MDIKQLTAFAFLVVLTLAPTVVSYASREKLTLTNLRCDDRINPLGIESEHPRLSWMIGATYHGVKQTAYHILVSDDPKLLEQGKGNVWNTGKIKAGTSIQVVYSGKPLAPGKKYYWKVKIWDNQGHVSPWSDPASWQMGLLSPQDWAGARWIGYDELPPSSRIVPAVHGGGKAEWGPLRDTLPLLRRSFVVEKPLTRATVFISGLGHFDLHVNGTKIGDHFLDPGWTNYGQAAQYVAFDVTNNLTTGTNALGVMLGNGFYHVPAERYRKLTGTFG